MSVGRVNMTLVQSAALVSIVFLNMAALKEDLYILDSWREIF